MNHGSDIATILCRLLHVDMCLHVRVYMYVYRDGMESFMLLTINIEL